MIKQRLTFRKHLKFSKNNDVLLSYKSQFKSFLAYSSAGDFVVGLGVTLIVHGTYCPLHKVKLGNLPLFGCM